MPLFSYTRDIPDGPNNPSNDQPNMKTNTNSADDIWKVDHYSFTELDPQGRNSGGSHEKVQMPEQLTIPGGLFSSAGTLYTKAAASATVNRSQLFYSNSDSGNEYQMTRVDNAQFSKFGQNVAYDPSGMAATDPHEGGWTFLPGGLFFMYGKRLSVTPGSDTIITYPFVFPTAVFSVSAISFRTGAIGMQVQRTINVNTTNFTVSLSGSGSGGSPAIYWSAIGK